MIPFFCDLDGVLVNQTGRDGFDKMPWMPDGKVLWGHIAQHVTGILTQLPEELYSRCAPQKRAWCARELGPRVAVHVVPDSVGKVRYASACAILIDDSERNCAQWSAVGGVAVRHFSAARTLERLIELKVVR